MMSSPTRPPESITCLAITPSSVPSRTAARNMSPVEMCGTTKCRESRTHCVPLPAPCRPRMMRRAPGITADLLQETLVVAQRELAVDLTHQFECDTDGDQHAGSGEAEGVDVGDDQQDVREHGDDRDEHGTGQRDPVDGLAQVALGLGAGTDTGDETALAPQLVGLTNRVEGDRVVEVGERHDHQREQRDVHEVLRVDDVLVDEPGDLTPPPFSRAEE